MGLENQCLCASTDVLARSVMSLYVDRVLVGTRESGSCFSDQITPVLIGAEHTSSGTAGYFTGLMEQACPYDQPTLAFTTSPVLNPLASTSTHVAQRDSPPEPPPPTDQTLGSRPSKLLHPTQSGASTRSPSPRSFSCASVRPIACLPTSVSPPLRLGAHMGPPTHGTRSGARRNARAVGTTTKRGHAASTARGWQWSVVAARLDRRLEDAGYVGRAQRAAHHLQRARQ